ncbi:thioredoxin family protein [bacterium]|nr:thioredoxin family protein [bacterium]
METIQLTASNFRDVVQTDGIVFIAAGADWCQDCRKFQPDFEQMANTYPEHRFAKLDTDQEPELKQLFNIRYIPTLIVYRDGEMLYNQPGGPPMDVFLDIVRQAEQLNINALKEERAEHIA